MIKREFVFKIDEIIDDGNNVTGKHYVVFSQSGYVQIHDDGRIEVLVNDKKQPHSQFESKDTFFNKLIKKIHKATAK